MNFNKKVLPSGLRIITVPMKDNPTITALVLVEAGSKYETKKINGISHFLEHMCFKGTTKRPTALDISKELDSVGAQYNAFTTQEFTGYYAKTDWRHLDKAIDVVSDIYLLSTLPEAEIEKEKGVIVEEINMYEDLPQRRVQDAFTTLLYGDTPAGWDIIGTKDTVRSFRREDFIKYRESHYVADATTIVVAGNFKEEEVIAKLEKVFEPIRHGNKAVKAKVEEGQKKPAVRVVKKETDQAHFVLGVRTFPIYDRRNPILKVIAGVLGAGMSSRLFQKVREEMGAGYYVGAAAEAFTDHGFFEVAAGVDQGRIKEVISVVLEEFNRMKKEDVPADELQKTKDYLIGSMYLSIESSDAVADLYGYQEIMRKEIHTPDKMASLIREVDVGSIRKLSQEIFVPENLNCAIIGKFSDEKEFLPILKV